VINLNRVVERVDRPLAAFRLSKIAWLLLAIGLIGVAARLSLWWVSTGTVDVKNWRRFGEEIANHGLAWTYSSDERFNHPPLIGLYVGAVWDITAGDPANFARLLKVPALIGEAIAIFALMRRLGAPAFAAYATAPAAILVSSYHGNTDSLYIAVILLAALAFQSERFFWAGLLFGAALNVKLLPLLLLPLLLIAAPSRRALARMLAGLSIGTIPYLPLT
jgi:Glycosyltransferase family 87